MAVRGVVPDPEHALRLLVTTALMEDVGPADVTTEWTVPSDARGRAVVVAKEPMVVSGMAVVETLLDEVGFGSRGGTGTLTLNVVDGDAAERETVLATLEGNLAHILTLERVALNFLGRLSGIATLTRRFVEAVDGTGARVVDTRKTTPGWRHLEKAAVRHGGGTNHRMGLWDMALVKDNHADASGGVAAAAEAAMAGARARAAETGETRVQVEVEVRSLDELEAVLPVGVDRILLDNMDTATLSEAVRRVHARDGDRPLLEASGNVRLDTVRAIAETGVDLISVGALTHSAPSADVSMRIAGVGEE